MGLPKVDATVGEKIRFYRKQAELTQKELAELCELSESAVRNYELGNRIPDFYTLHTIAEKLRVNYYAIADVKISELGGAVQALYDMETCYGLYPTVVDGKIHFVFRDSVSVGASPDQVDLERSSAGTLLQLLLRGYLRTCALYQAGKLADEEYALWKSKSPAYLEDCRKIFRQSPESETEIFQTAAPVPKENTQEPSRRRKRKINNGR